MKEIKRDNAVIDYQSVGDGQTTLLFVHGSYIDQTYWKPQVSYFSLHYRVITFDLPGHGKSGKERKHWSLQGFADDVTTLIEKLDLKNVILIGHSVGGEINLLANTNTAPIIGFIGIDNFKDATTPLPVEMVNSILENLKKNFENTNEQYVRTGLLTAQTPAAITKRVVSDYRNAYKPMGFETMPEIFNVYQKEKELLPQLKFKLYLINIDYLPVNEAPLKQYAGSGYEIAHMKGTCHFPILENPDELNRLLQQTINKIIHKANT